MRPIRVVLFGVGAMNQMALGLLLECGVEVVGALARSPDRVGRDLADVAGLAQPLGVIVESDAEELLARTTPDLVLIATCSYMSEVEGQLRVCAAAGVDAITLSEELIYPWRTSPEASRALDSLASENGATIVGGGYQDIYLVNLVALLMGSAHRVDSVSGVSTFNVDDFGPEIARDMQVGSTAAQLGLWLREAERPPSFGANVLDALAAKLGLTVGRAATRTRPVFAETAMYCRSLGLEVAPGGVIGLVDRDTVQTEEGPELSLELAGRLYHERERDVNEWKVHGEPELSLVNPAVDTRTTTCTQLVNRIPDVLAAPPGLLTVARLPTPRYRQRPFATDRESTVR